MEGRLKALNREPLARAAAGALAPSEDAWVVGGALRDLALGRPGPLVDLDLAVTGSAAAYAKRLARRARGTHVVLDAAQDIHRVVLKSGGAAAQVDAAGVQGGSIAADLARRDFTVNAMALPFSAPGPLLDPFRGLADAAAGTLRAVSEKAFTDDPLRALRAFRIGAQCRLEPEAKTLLWAKRHRALLASCAAERVRAEVMGVLAASDSAAWLRRMDGAGLLTQVLPELEASRRCALVYYGKGGVLRHALDTVERLDFLAARLERVWPAHAAAVRAAWAGAPGGAAGHPALLRLGGLLHDVSKPETAKRQGGRLRFFGHEAVGAEKSAGILERLRFSREETDWVSTWVLHHLRPGNLAAAGAVSDKAVYRFFRDLGPKGVSQLLVCWADHASYLAPKDVERALPSAAQEPGRPMPRWAVGDAAKTIHHMRVVSWLLGRWFLAPESARPERLLDGRDVMKALKIKPGPRVGELLKGLEEAQAEGTVRSRKDALAWVARQPPGGAPPPPAS
jgi:putative nucleotidyltransferase with HDIG domain